MTSPLPCLVSEDGRLAQLGDTRLEAAEVEAIVRALLGARAVMHPRRFPLLFEGVPILLGDGFAWTTDAEGRRLGCVHLPGAGWIGAEVRTPPVTRPVRPRARGGDDAGPDGAAGGGSRSR